MPPAVEMQYLKHQTAREVPPPLIFEDEIPGGKMNSFRKKKIPRIIFRGKKSYNILSRRNMPQLIKKKKTYVTVVKLLF